ncbi:MAG: hypothetical protein ACRD22_02775 [Terriglobia bacterium]
MHKTLRFTLAAALMAYSALSAYAGNEKHIDGSWWAKHSDAERTLVVEGIVDGENVATEQIGSQLCAKKLDEPSKKGLDDWLACKPPINAHFSLPIFTYVYFVTKFYSKYRDPKVDVAAIVLCHRDGKYRKEGDANECEKQIL